MEKISFNIRLCINAPKETLDVPNVTLDVPNVTFDVPNVTLSEKK